VGSKARQLEEAIIGEGPDTVAAFVFEPVQGDGGAVDMHREFFPLAQEICKRHGVLMIADEVKADIPV
jgi:4-aminobutyrate aminotransferase-like enzyme